MNNFKKALLYFIVSTIVIYVSYTIALLIFILKK